MVVLDTHAWFWWLTQPARLSGKAREACARADVLLVPAISVWELGMMVAKGRVGLDRDVGEWVAAALAQPRVRLAPLTPGVAIASTRLPGGIHGDPSDRLIVATALEHACPLITADDRLLHYPHVRTIW